MSIFSKYRHEMKSQKLWEEIEYVLKLFQEPMLSLYKQVLGQLSAVESNPAALKSVFEILLNLSQIFYLLNLQEIPEFFEDHIDDWFTPFLELLKYNNATLDPVDDSQPGLLDRLRTSILENVDLYTTKYEEQSSKLVGVFVEESWTLLTRLDGRERFDALVTTAVRFLTSVVKKEWHKALFSSPQALKTICEKVVIPQLKLRESDVELFQMDGIEYIRRDIEGSDIDTRRRTTVEFVRGLCVHFESEITAILKEYVNMLLTDYAKAPDQNWVAKDAAMYIILALTAKGGTAAQGTTLTNPYVDLISFFGTQVLPELQATPIDNNPVLKADCLKFVATFRRQLPLDSLPQLVSLLLPFLASEEFVLHTYAANAIEKLLGMREKGIPLFTREKLSPLLTPLLTGLFGVLAMEESRENEYIMKAIMRICQVAKEDIQNAAGLIISKLTDILSYVALNPRKPAFNHNLFETIACLVANLCKNNPAMVSSFEASLFPPFQTMLGMETCQEFGPYVFQIMAQLLECRTDLSEAYHSLFPMTLAPALWENMGE